ncbi:MAG TPA: hypothetical protein VM619_16785 [Luteimonas sp.]|nr:hypothetical protein [Luteimonas sp.]
MTNFPAIKEAYLLALLPLIGIAIVAVHQMGRYQFYGVPLEYLEIDTVKIILSGLSLALYAAASIYAITALMSEQNLPSWPSRFIAHLFIAAFLTMPYWVGNLSIKNSISWPTLLFIGFCACVTATAEYKIRRLNHSDKPVSRTELINTAAGVGFWVILLVLLATFTHGALTAKDQTKRTFIEGTNLMIVARSGDVLITKKYDPTRQSFDKDRTVLVVLDKSTTLVTREAPLK